ncbi:MAG: DHH family phosphoesterase [Candidatus Lokiarchaeota archaeon]|nr:DHH family phosphoesterase [Candidatus Lokiarchaeota archaeon]
MLYSKYEDFLSFLQYKKILITTHDLVDIDGFASCFALKFFLCERFNKSPSIFFSELSKATKNFMNKFLIKFPEFKFDYETEVNLANYDVCLIIDTNDLSQIHFNSSKSSKLDIPYILIDHHHYGKTELENRNISSLNLINDDISSSAEIILDLIESQNQDLPTRYRYLMAAAILVDSGFFRYGNNGTIRKFSRLLDEKVNYQHLLNMLQNETDISEKIAKIKGLQRVELIRKGDYLIGVSNVSSFGANVASMLIKNGFDVGIVYSVEKNRKNINSRAKKSVCLNTGLHLGKILEELSKYADGSGGGHDGAASIAFNAELKQVLSKFIEKIKHFL